MVGCLNEWLLYVGRLQETGMNMSNLFAKQLITTTVVEKVKKKSNNK